MSAAASSAVMGKPGRSVTRMPSGVVAAERTAGCAARRACARTPSLGTITFELIRRYVADLVVVPDAALLDAMRWIWERMKLVVEPTGCLGLAAARERKAQLAGQRVGVIVSGGNVDLARFAALIAG